MLFGTAKRNITPPMPVRLAGYASRTTAFEAVEEDIYLRVHVHRMQEAQLIFIYGDLIWWNTEFTDRAAELLKKELGLAPETVFFTASHNHSGPPTGNTFLSCLEEGDESYTEFLLKEVLKGVQEALAGLDEVSVWRFDAHSEVNVFRRLWEGDRVVMKPDFNTPADHNLTLLGFLGADGEMKGLLVHFPCHANISGKNTVQPDYPGIALRMLDEAYPGCISLFWQGCTGDLRPRNVLGSHFAAGDYTGAKEFAEDFFKDCQKALARSGKKVTEKPQLQTAELLLPVRGRRTVGELQALAASGDSLEGAWARKVLSRKNPEAERLRIRYLSYGEALSVYFFNAEMSQEYGFYARELDPAAICTAYADGMTGYLCTAKQIEEGGYEPEGSARYFALSGTFCPAVEGLIKSKMKEMRDKIC